MVHCGEYIPAIRGQPPRCALHYTTDGRHISNRDVIMCDSLRLLALLSIFTLFSQSHIVTSRGFHDGVNNRGLRFGMCFGPKSQKCWVQNTSRIQNQTIESVLISCFRADGGAYQRCLVVGADGAGRVRADTVQQHVHAVPHGTQHGAVPYIRGKRTLLQRVVPVTCWWSVACSRTFHLTGVCYLLVVCCLLEDVAPYGCVLPAPCRHFADTLLTLPAVHLTGTCAPCALLPARAPPTLLQRVLPVPRIIERIGQAHPCMRCSNTDTIGLWCEFWLMCVLEHLAGAIFIYLLAPTLYF